jgi:DNA-binding NarL/FixJ family response regulator
MAAFAGSIQLRRSDAFVMETSSIRILIAEDHFIARAGVAAIVNAQPDMQVVGEATNGERAVALYRELRPDVALMDVRMPGMSGLDAVSAILAEFPDARIVVLSSYGGDEDIHRAFLVGVHSYLTKDVLHDDLIRAIQCVHAGQKYIPPPIAAALAAQSPRPDLSMRELEVLKLVVQGMGNKQIAYALNMAEDTAKNHVKHILSKLGAKDRTQAATVALQRGIVHLEDYGGPTSSVD